LAYEYFCPPAGRSAATHAESSTRVWPSHRQASGIRETSPNQPAPNHTSCRLAAHICVHLSCLGFSACSTYHTQPCGTLEVVQEASGRRPPPAVLNTQPTTLGRFVLHTSLGAETKQSKLRDFHVSRSRPLLLLLDLVDLGGARPRPRHRHRPRPLGLRRPPRRFTWAAAPSSRAVHSGGAPPGRASPFLRLALLLPPAGAPTPTPAAAATATATATATAISPAPCGPRRPQRRQLVPRVHVKVARQVLQLPVARAAAAPLAPVVLCLRLLLPRTRLRRVVAVHLRGAGLRLVLRALQELQVPLAQAAVRAAHSPRQCSVSTMHAACACVCAVSGPMCDVRCVGTTTQKQPDTGRYSAPCGLHRAP
jgi:hypothetical protein